MLYYTDPLAAAIMTRNFGVEYKDSYKTLTNSGFSLCLVVPVADRRIVHPNSYHIFEPQVGDVCGNASEHMGYLEVLDNEYDSKKAHGYSIDTCIRNIKHSRWKVIQRNNKPFFWPKED